MAQPQWMCFEEFFGSPGGVVTFWAAEEFDSSRGQPFLLLFRRMDGTVEPLLNGDGFTVPSGEWHNADPSWPYSTT